MNNSLLPPNATPYMRVMEQVMAPILQIPVDIISSIWNPLKCPVNMLPWLAAQLSVDSWEEDWPVDMQRAVIAASIEVHRHKGTIGAIKRFLISAGYGDATIIEGSADTRYDGTYSYDGSVLYGDPNEWATYEITMLSPVPNGRIDALRKAIELIAPARSNLTNINFVVAIAYDGETNYDGTHNYGVG